MGRDNRVVESKNPTELLGELIFNTARDFRKECQEMDFDGRVLTALMGTVYGMKLEVKFTYDRPITK